nr:hypothetical protein [Tanacetum cinerariifolium]
MATTIEQQVALDEALVPSTKRSPFFKAFLVTVDVPEIYMQEFWATAYVHQHSIRFKMDTRKNIVDLEAFREMLHISPRVSGQSFTELPFKEVILEFLRFLGHSAQIKTLTDVVLRHQNTQQYGAILPIELTTGDIRNTKAYKEYYACATREAAPKPKASARRKKAAAKGKQRARATCPTEPSEVERTKAEQLKIILRRSRQETHISQHGGLSTDEGIGSKPRVPDVPSDDSDEEISWNSSDEEDVDDQTKGRDGNEESGEGDAEETKSDGESEEEEIREEEEESFDLILRTLEDDEDDGNGDENQGLMISDEERIQEEEEADKLYRDQESSSVSSFVTSMLNPTTDAGVESIFMTASSPIAPLPTPTPIMTPSTIATITTTSEAPIPPTTFPSAVLEHLLTSDSQMTKAVREAVQIQTDRLQDSFQRENDEFLRTIDENMKKIIKGQAKTDLTEMELKKILIEKMEGNKSIQRSDEQWNLYKALVDAYEADKTILESYGDTCILKRRRGDDDDQEGPSAGSDRGSKRRKPPTPNRDWNKTLPAIQERAQTWISELAKQADSRSFFNELLDTPIDFSNFIMNWLCVDTLTPKLLARPTFELMRGLCQQYPHNLLQPLPLIPDNRGRRVIPFAHFINNELKYLRGGASSRKYTTSVTKTKVADYGHIKWIEDLVPHTMWIQEPLNYDKHALWGVSYWGQKRQQFYGFAVNREFALDVYSKRRIITVTDLKIVEWHNYKHLDWISLSNLTVEERFAFNISLRMFTRSIVIQRRVEDLQLGVESYQKRLNLTKPDTYQSDLKRRKAYTAYSNPRGFIYQNKDKKNRLMRIDELYKFTDGMLNDVCNALDDRLKGIRM